MQTDEVTVFCCSSCGSALAASIAPPPAANFVTRAVQMLEGEDLEHIEGALIDI